MADFKPDTREGILEIKRRALAGVSLTKDTNASYSAKLAKKRYKFKKGIHKTFDGTVHEGIRGKPHGTLLPKPKNVTTEIDVEEVLKANGIDQPPEPIKADMVIDIDLDYNAYQWTNKW